MGFTMAKGSLFAILLRSPWWYSALLALLCVCVSILLVGSKFLIFGVAAAIPFIAIAVYSAYRTFQRPGKKRIIEVVAEARAMPARDLASRIAGNYEKINFDITPLKGDAAELELERGRHKFLLNCKRFKAAKTGIEPLKQLVARGEKQEATGYLYVTLGEITDNARKFARDNDIDLIQAEALTEFFDGKKQLL